MHNKNLVSKHKWKDQWKDIPGASNFHNDVRDLLRTTIPFKNMKCYQEVAVCDVFPEYKKRNEHYDWYIYELNLIVELHGKQHYSVVNYGNTDGDKAIRALYAMQSRDSEKEWAARKNNFNYIAIPYWEKLSAEKLKSLLLEAL
jgi:hypothetical protein